MTAHFPEIYPPIPEVLPAALIRFAASFEASSSFDMMQLQMSLVLAIVLVDSPDHVAGEWTIVGVQKEMGQLVTQWLQPLRRSTPTTPSQRLTVARTCHDLVASAGWTPRKDIADAVVKNLLPIVERTLPIVVQAQERELLKDEVLEASSFTQVLAVLLAMGSRSLIPDDCLSSVVETLCRVLVELGFDAVIAGSTDSSQPAVSAGDAVDLFWALLSNEYSAISTVEALISMLYEKESSLCILHRLSIEHWSELDSSICKKALVATRILSSAKSRATSPPLLRTYWQHVIFVVLDCLEVCRASYSNARGSGCEVASRMLDQLAVELILCLKKSIAHDIRASDNMMLSEVEWEAIIIRLRVILSWFTVNESEARTSAGSFWMTVCSFLDYATKILTVSFVEYNFQKQLYIFLLREVSPLLGTDSRNVLGRSTLLCWIKFGLFPHRLEGLTKTASDIVKQAFAKTSAGLHVHDASVRLATIKALTNEDGTIGGNLSSEHAPSLLTLTMHMREQSLDFVRTCVIPTLTHSLLGSTRMDFASNPDDVQGNDLDELSMYLVHLVGRLYRGTSGDRQHRLLFVDLLGSVALNKKVELDGDRRTVIGLSHGFGVRIGAVMELERCLEAAFTTLMHAHESIPVIVDVLCSVFGDYADCFSEIDLTQYEGRRLTQLAALSLDPLSRLRVAIDGHVAFRPRSNAIEDANKAVELFYEAAMKPYRSAVVETWGALFVVSCIADDDQGRFTCLSFDSIVRCVLRFLENSIGVIVADVSLYVQRCLTIHCFDLLGHLFLASIPARVENSAAHRIFSATAAHEPRNVTLARGLALSKCVEARIILERKPGSAGIESSPDLHLLLELIAGYFMSSSPIERDTIFLVLAALLPSLTEMEQASKGALGAVVSSLHVKVSDMKGRVDADEAETTCVLSLMHDFLMTVLKPSVPGDLWSDFTFLCLHQMVSRRTLKTPYPLYLALGFLPGLLDRLDHVRTSEMLCRVEDLFMGSTDDAVHAVRVLMKHRVERQDKDEGKHSASGLDLTTAPAFRLFDRCLEADESAAWLLSDCVLLTCRVGDQSSNDAGLLELELRSLDGRTRELLSLARRRSGPSPDDLLSPPNCSPDIKSFPPLWRLPRELSDKYNAVLASFDKIVGTQSSEREENEPVASKEYFERPMGHAAVLAWLRQLGSAKNVDEALLNSSLTAMHQHCGTPKMPLSNVPGPIRLQCGTQLSRAISVLDRIPWGGTHRMSLLYDQSAVTVDAVESAEARLLSTNKCSPAFYRFANALGEIVPVRRLINFSGGLDTSDYESDGKYTLVWSDESKAKSDVGSHTIIFHVVSFMPSDGSRTFLNRKRHIGNDFVLILFSDRGSDALVDFDLQGGELIAGAFGHVVIFVTLSQPNVYRVNVRVREHKSSQALNATLATLVSDSAVSVIDAPTFVRNIAMRADLACRAFLEDTDAPSNYLHRFQILQEMKRLAVA